MAEAKTISHALATPCPISALVTKCGMKLTKRTSKRHELAFNAAAATCVPCAAVVKAELEVTRATRGHVPEPLRKYYDWADGPDSGISSKTLVDAIAGTHVNDWRNPGHPHDPADFGRCYRVLKLFPELRPQVAKVAEKSGEWARLVGAWDELEALYEEELPQDRAPKLYARMRELIDGK